MAGWSIRTIPRYSLVDMIWVGRASDRYSSRGLDLAIDEQHVALPKLYGAPAYARPPRQPVAEVERPFDPDDLPIEVEMTEEERELAATLPAHTYAPGGHRVASPTTATVGDGAPSLNPRPLSLKALAGRILGDS